MGAHKRGAFGRPFTIVVYVLSYMLKLALRGGFWVLENRKSLETFLFQHMDQNCISPDCRAFVFTSFVYNFEILKNHLHGAVCILPNSLYVEIWFFQGNHFQKASLFTIFIRLLWNFEQYCLTLCCLVSFWQNFDLCFCFLLIVQKVFFGENYPYTNGFTFLWIFSLNFVVWISLYNIHAIFLSRCGIFKPFVQWEKTWEIFNIYIFQKASPFTIFIRLLWKFDKSCVWYCSLISFWQNFDLRLCFCVIVQNVQKIPLWENYITV